MSQLQKLVKPFPARYIHQNPGSGNRGSYVSHDVVTQRLLHVLGPFSTSVREVLRGDTKEQANVVVGVVLALTVHIDGRTVTVTEIGDCENPKNWPHDGARMKDAMSDAIKRCAMRLGVGLHLWAGEEWFLDRALEASASAEGGDKSTLSASGTGAPTGGRGSGRPAPSTDKGAA